MKKFTCLILTLALTLCSLGAFAAGRTLSEQYPLLKTPSELTEDEIMYQCEFTAELDETYRGTWLYSMSERGIIHAALTRTNYVQADYGTYAAPISDYILTLKQGSKKYSMFNIEGNAPFGSRGIFEFCDCNNYIDEDDRTVSSYGLLSGSQYVMNMNLSEKDGEKSIEFFVYNASAGIRNGKYLIKTNTITVDGADITEYDKPAERGKTESDYVYNNGYNDYSEKDFSAIAEAAEEAAPDSGAGDDTEKGGNWVPGQMFTTGDMESRAKDNTRVIRGEDYDDVYDYNVEYTAEFTANIKNSQTAAQLSGDGNITATYYGISVSCKGKDGTPKVGRNIKLLRLKGNKLERWYEVSAIEYPDIKIEGAVFHSEYNKVSNDAQIYEGFAVISGFDGTKYKPADRTTTNVGITYNYSSDARTFLKSLTFEIDGSRAEVPYNDIDYTGKFMSTFFGDVFENSDEILSEMGL